MDFTIPENCCIEIKENEKKRKEPQPYQRTKQAKEYECDGDANCNWSSSNGPYCFIKVLEVLEIGGDQPNYNIQNMVF